LPLCTRREGQALPSRKEVPIAFEFRADQLHAQLVDHAQSAQVFGNRIQFAGQEYRPASLVLTNDSVRLDYQPIDRGDRERVVAAEFCRLYPDPESDGNAL